MRAATCLLIGLLFLFGCGTTSTAPTAKAVIQGQVSRTGPIAWLSISAWVFTNPPTDTVKTDSLGRYIIDVPPGRYTLSAFDNNGGVSRSSDTVTAMAGRIDTVNLVFAVP
jgi:hypothetical protein